MIAFVLIAAFLVVAGLSWLLRPLVAKARPDGAVREASNLAIIRGQLEDIELDVSTGALSPEQSREARAELERRALDEGRAPTRSQTSTKAPSAGGRRTALALTLAIPCAAALLYWQLGNFDAFAPPAPAGVEQQVAPADVEQMVARLAAHLEEKPDDSRGWSVLARSYYAMNRFPDAAKAYERLAALEPDNADVLANYADALAMALGRNAAGKPMELVRQALKIDPAQWKALAIAGSEAFERKDFPAAVGYWERARAVVPADSELSKSIEGSIAQARAAGSLSAVPSGAVSAPVGAKGGAVSGTVTLSPTLAARADSADTVFVFARAAEGPRMPLAILRIRVADLPYRFALDDTQAMAPNMKISSFAEVVVGARISKSAEASARAGDLQGLSRPFKVGATDIAVVIDSVVR